MTSIPRDDTEEIAPAAVPGATEVPLYMAREGFGPSAAARALREAGRPVQVPLPFGAGAAWLVSRYDDVRAVLSDPVTFSNDLRAMSGILGVGMTEEELEQERKGQLLGLDPPDHTWLRRILGREFTTRRMRRLVPRIEEIVRVALDRLEEVGPGGDLVEIVTQPVPALVIFELLGVPQAARAVFEEVTTAQLDMSLPEPQRVQLAMQVHGQMAELVAHARATPGDDLLGTLVREHGDELDDTALTNVGAMLLTAGHETTASMLGLGVLALVRHPEELARLRAGEVGVENAVEELLRYLSVTHTGIPRVATRDVVLAGQTVARGELVLFALAPANRDPRRVAEPDRLELSRAPTAHVAFGHGVHHCLGAPLARLELQIALTALLERFPELEVTIPIEEVGFRMYHSVYGLDALPVAW